MSTTVTLNESQAAYTVPFDESVLARGPVFLERKGRRVALLIRTEEFEAFRTWQGGRLIDAGADESALACRMLLHTDRPVHIQEVRVEALGRGPGELQKPIGFPPKAEGPTIGVKQ